MELNLRHFPVYNIEFEISPTVWASGSAHIVFPHYNKDLVCTLMCVVRKDTDNEDGIYYVRSIGQIRGWR